MSYYDVDKWIEPSLIVHPAFVVVLCFVAATALVLWWAN